VRVFTATATLTPSLPTVTPTLPSLGLSAVLLVAGGPPKTVTFTPDVTQLGAAFFPCSESTCGTGEQHDNMLGTIRVVNP
jgi:hypothetical protein